MQIKVRFLVKITPKQAERIITEGKQPRAGDQIAL
jgi:hypothetical protein